MAPVSEEEFYLSLQSPTTFSDFRGRYFDRLSDEKGGTLWESGWRRNRVVESGNRLLAALIRWEPGFSGNLFWALGEGAVSWDNLMPSPNVVDTHLSNEIGRKSLAADQVHYIDGNNNVTDTPTSRLGISVTFTGEELGQGVHSLREFGLFGGDATEAANSGWMIDYVIHPRITLSAGMTLTRTLHLSFGGKTQGEVVGGFGASLSVMSIDGLGAAYASQLGERGITSLGDLIGIDPQAVIGNI